MLRFFVCFCVVATLTFVTVTPFCGKMFDCGCTLFEGMQYCNVYNTEGPRCPWCSYGALFFTGQLGLILAGTGLTIWAVLKWIKPVFWLGVMTGVIAYLLLSSLVGLGIALYVGYPSFYGVGL